MSEFINRGVKIIDAELIEVGTPKKLSEITGKVLNFGLLGPDGFISLEILSAGATSKLQVQELCSNSGVTFSVPVDKDSVEVDDIVTEQTPGTGFYSPAIDLCKEFDLLFTATTANATVTVWMSLQ